MSLPLTDVHAHFLTDRYVREARARGVDRPDGMPRWPEWSPSAHLDVMDRVGIGRAILSVSSPGVHFGDDGQARALAQHLNDTAVEVAADHPGRFGLFAALPLPDVDGAMREAVRALDDLGADGVGMLTHHQGAYLSAPELDPLWELLDERGAVVHVHPTSPPGWQSLPDRPRPMIEFMFDTARAFVELLMARVPERFAGIRFIASHCGGALPLVIERVDRFTSAFAEPADVRGQLRRLWVDAAGTPLPDALPAAIGMVGEDQVLYGSDFCFTPPPAVAGQVASLGGLAPESGRPWLEQMARNADRLLGAGRTDGHP